MLSDDGIGAGRFSAAELAAVLLPVEQASNLPGALYTAADVFAIERDEIFRRMWLCIGRDEDIAGPGDFFTTEVFGEPLLVTRGRDGAARAFYNVCRHRGACLVADQRGAVRAFRCHYHAWSYDPEGRLIAAPLMQERPGFDPADWSLRPLPLRSRDGFLFVSLDERPQPLAEQLHDFPDVSAYGLAGMRRGHRLQYDVAANWKVICENFSECYHCALVHPQLNRVSDFRSGGTRLEGESFNGGPMELNPGMATMSMSGASPLPRIAGLEGERQVQYYTVYPNMLLGLVPDYAFCYTLWPSGPDRTRLVCDFLFPPGSLAATPDLSDIVEFWDVTNRQDWQLCESVQRAAGSRGARPGPYHPAEACVHAFDSWYVQRLRQSLMQLAD